MLADCKQALRQIWKFPGYTAVVVLTLAFGIAVNSQVFTLVSGLFLQPMLVRDPGRLTAIVQRNDIINVPQQLSFPDFQDIRAGSKALMDHIAFLTTPAHVGVPAHPPERIAVELVTPDAFAKLGVGAALGRPLQPGDGETALTAPVAVLTFRFWQSRFGADPAAVGRTVLVDGKPFTIVGVAPRGFESFTYLFSAGLFLPSGAAPLLRPDGDSIFKYRGYATWRVLAYLRPGSSMAEANSELAVFANRFAKEFPDEHRNVRFQAVPESRARPDPSLIDFTPVFAGLFIGLVVLVLLIACANVTNLMSARALDREKELVVRAALGASRWCLMRQLLVESVMLALLAGAVGFGIASWAGDILRQFQFNEAIPFRELATPAWRVCLFTAMISLLAGLAAGLVPALRSSRVDLNEGLKQGGTRHTGAGRHRLRDLLVVGQVALSCVVLISAALFLRALTRVRHLDFGFRPDHIVMLSLDLSLQGYDQARGLRFQQQVIDRVRALPGVDSVNFAEHVPFAESMVLRDCYPDHPTGRVPGGHVAVALSAVTPWFVKDFGVRLLRGRNLGPTDDEKSPHVAVINEAMAAAFWPGVDPIGQRFHRDWQGGPAIEVVGLVRTGKYILLSEEPRPYYYVPFAQAYEMPATLVVRTLVDPHTLANPLRAVVHSIDPDLPVYGVVTLDEHLNSSSLAFMPLRVGSMLAGIQGGVGLLLAILGLYSVVSYDIGSRTREIGIRMALGAGHRDILRFVSRAGLRLTLVGLLAGLAMALLLSLALPHVLVGVQPADPVALLLVGAALATTAALACWLPARRATRVNPVEALRAE